MTSVASAVRRPSTGFVRALLSASRPLSWVNTAYPFAAAYLVSGGGVDAVLLVGTVWLLVPYNLLMYGVNDVFDYESDVRNDRKGGVEGAVLPPRWHPATLWAAALASLPFVLALVALGNPTSTAVLVVLVFAVVAYSAPGLRFKERPLLDSVTSSTHFAGPAVLGLALSPGGFTPVSVAAVAGFFLWGMASQAFGAVQDIGPDRAAGIGSVATALGAATTTRLAAGLYAAAAMLLLLTGWPGALAALLVVPYLLNVAPFLSVPDDRAEAANAGWRRFLWLNFVTGFLLTQLLIWTNR